MLESLIRLAQGMFWFSFGSFPPSTIAILDPFIPLLLLFILFAAAHARLMFRNEVRQLDAIAAILCMESSMTTSPIVDIVGNALHSNFTVDHDEECILTCDFVAYLFKNINDLNHFFSKNYNSICFYVFLLFFCVHENTCLFLWHARRINDNRMYIRCLFSVLILCGKTYSWLLFANCLVAIWDASIRKCIIVQPDYVNQQAAFLYVCFSWHAIDKTQEKKILKKLGITQGSP